MSWTNFLPQFPPVEKFTFTVSNSAHGKVFIPISMVEPDEKIVESSIAENSVRAKNVLVGAGVITDNSRHAAVMNEQMLATELGPEVAGETSMEEQLELLRRFENGKVQHQQPASYSQNPYHLAYSQYSALTPYTAIDPLLGIGSALLPSSVNPPIYQSSDGEWHFAFYYDIHTCVHVVNESTMKLYLLHACMYSLKIIISIMIM